MRFLLYSLLLVAVSLPVLVYGQGKVYSPLVNIPGNGANGFEQYISFLYGASISVAALLAVVKIIIAGAKYMMSDVITNKGEALADIQGAILGLLLILGAVIILEFINPQLIKRDIKFEPIAKRADITARASIAAVAQQQTTALMAGLDSCVQSLTSPSQDGAKMLTTINVSACGTFDNKVTQLNAFASNCKAKGGHSYNNGAGTDRATCAIPLDTGREYVGFTITDYANIDPSFIKLEGNMVIVDIKGQCQKKVLDSGATDGGVQDNIFKTCSANAVEAVKEYCVDDNGGNYSGTKTTATCEKPIRRAFLSDLDKELEQYKTTLPDTDYAGRGLTDANQAPDSPVVMKVCKIWGGEFRDIDGSENICVDFDSDPNN
jgi:hypothetical protein